MLIRPLLCSLLSIALITAAEGDCDLILKLYGKGFATPVIELERRNGAWQSEVWGTIWSRSRADHTGTATVTEDGTSLTITIDMPIRPDGWHRADHGHWQITGTATDKAFTGTWTGTIHGRDGTGEAVGTITAPHPVPVVNHRPVEPGEHPRLCFRREDIPAIRRFATSPTGQALVTRLDEVLAKPIDFTGGYGSNAGYHAAGHALRYLLTEDPAAAEQALDIALKASSARLGVDHLYAQSHPAFGVALTYDLCYDAWDPVSRQEIARYLDRIGRRLVSGAAKGFNTNGGSNWSARCRGSGGVALLAIEGDPLPPPSKQAVVDLPRSIEPLTDIDDEIPADLVKIGRMPSTWLVSNDLPLSRKIRLKHDGWDIIKDKQWSAGAATLRDGTAVTFAPLAGACLFNDDRTRHSRAIDLSTAHGEAGSRIFLRSRFQIEHDGVYQLVTDLTGSADAYWGDHGYIWLNGQMIRERQALRLDAGTYEIMVGDDRTADTPTATDWTMPRLVKAEDGLASIDRWRQAVADWQAADRSASNTYWIGSARRACQRWIEQGSGDRGFLAEGDGYGAESLIDGIMPFAIAYRTSQGYDMAPGDSLEWVLPLYATRCTSVDGRWHAGKWGRHHGCNFSAMFPAGITLANPALRPALHTWFDERWGMNGDRTFGCGHPHKVIYAFAARLGKLGKGSIETLPTELHDRRRDYFVWRDRHSDEHDCVVSLHARGGKSAGWWAHDAATFRLRGLGHAWALRNEDKGLDWQSHNTLRIEGYANAGGAPVLEHGQIGKQRYHVVLDTGRSMRIGKKKKYLTAWNDGDKTTDGSLRHVIAAFDAGPRVLLIVGDRIRGHADRTRSWTMWIPATANCEIHTHGFTITQPGGVLSAIVDCDASWHAHLGPTSRGGQRCLTITANAEATHVLVAMALDQTATVMAMDDAANIVIGDEQVRWDGDRLVLESR